jgi:hypothetical protein
MMWIGPVDSSNNNDSKSVAFIPGSYIFLQSQNNLKGSILLCENPDKKRRAIGGAEVCRSHPTGVVPKLLSNE